MIYFISDPHGGERPAGLNNYLSIAKKDDLLIILGDLGTKFEDTTLNKEFTEYFLSLDIEVAFLDGNHENFEYFNSFPLDTWMGGKVHRLSKNIVHLIRGNLYDIENNKFFVMGGCKSSQKWIDAGKWSPLEIPSEEEFNLAYDNLNKLNNKVDYILTHKYSSKLDYTLDYPKNSIEGLTKYIDTKVEFKHWYSGHWHKTIYKDDKHTVVDSTPILLK